MLILCACATRSTARNASLTHNLPYEVIRDESCASTAQRSLDSATVALTIRTMPVSSVSASWHITQGTDTVARGVEESSMPKFIVLAPKDYELHVSQNRFRSARASLSLRRACTLTVRITLQPVAK